MNRAISYQKPSLIFRQWSRKNYAVFVSIGKEVKIGHVDTIICEKALEKNNTKKTFNYDGITSSILENDDPEKVELLTTSIELISFLPVVNNLDESPQHCCKRKFPYKYTFNVTSCFAGCRKLLNKFNNEK